ncbi:MAG: sugar phosphate isomerase/epimerase family protein [Bryobacteraceae bacterium]
MAAPLRFSVCNEVFETTPFAESCAAIRLYGYDGIEIAPFTLAEQPSDISAAQRAEYRLTMADHQLAFVGLHWLMVSPKGLHVTTPDNEVRAKSWEHIRRLIDLCADLGDGGVLVFGSPKQRSSTGGMTPAEATKVFTEELAKMAAQAEGRNVRILVEALPHNQSDIINRLADAAAIVEQIGSPAVRTMFDSHNAVDETDPHPELIRRYWPYIEHIHVNELDGREPGTGDYDFQALMNTLAALNYQGWISLEVFDFSHGAETITRGAIEHLRGVVAGR